MNVAIMWVHIIKPSAIESEVWKGTINASKYISCEDHIVPPRFSVNGSVRYGILIRVELKVLLMRECIKYTLTQRRSEVHKRSLKSLSQHQ